MLCLHLDYISNFVLWWTRSLSGVVPLWFRFTCDSRSPRWNSISSLAHNAQDSQRVHVLQTVLPIHIVVSGGRCTFMHVLRRFCPVLLFVAYVLHLNIWCGKDRISSVGYWYVNVVLSLSFTLFELRERVVRLVLRRARSVRAALSPLQSSNIDH